MQINSAQDYLTAQKRRIVAATFATVARPVHRRHNGVYLSVLANKETQYDKVAYPQTISLAPGSVPGGVYTAAGVKSATQTQTTRPTVNSCANCRTAGTIAGSLI